MIGRLAFWLIVLTAATSSADRQFVLLDNGNVLAGKVRLIDSEYLVAGDGFEIRLPAATVRFVEPSLDALAIRVRSENPRPTVEERLRLADWCGRQQLWSHAVQELLAAQQGSPKDPRVVAAQRRLWHARELVLKSQPTSAPRVDPAVQTASHEQPVAAQAAAAPLAALPEGALQQFTRQVQRILVNNCTTAGCHAVGGPQEFQLNRDVLHGIANRRSTEVNLTATLRQVELNDPQASPLLIAMRPSHAGGRGARLGPRRDEWVAAINDWVTTVAGRPKETPPTAAPQSSRPSAEAPAPPGDVYAPGYYEALLQGEESKPTPPSLQRGAELKPVRERDEFDPERFNEQFGDAEQR